MYIDKPPWLEHSDQTFSLDIDASGARLVTSSTGAVRVWSLAPILDEPSELDASKPRLLATLQDHSAPVNVARFSRAGGRLATGSDDTCVVVSELRPGAAAAAAAFGGGAGAQRGVEAWRPVQVLRGHSSIVADLAWSHDDQLLATASIDSLVGIWAVGERPYRLVTFIKGHAGHVKGVAWDPLGRYLASQGDDGVRVWACDGWGQVAHLSAEFKFASKQMFNLRLAWSPDGQWLAAPNAFDRRTQRNHCRVYKRDQWDEFFCFVGHNAPVVAVRPNPRLFYTPVAPSAGAAGAAGGPETIVARGVGQKGGGGPGGSGAGGVEVSEEPSTVFALASMDKQFSVWSSGRPRAVVLGSRVSKLGILDAAWTPDGYNLVVLSLDGAVVTCRFQEDELGRPMSDAAMAAHMERLYGDPALRAADRQLLEGPEALLLLEGPDGGAAAAPGARGAAGRGGGGAGGAAAAAAAAGRGGGGVGGRGDALASRVMPQGPAAAASLPQ